jgi:hypothetical protein
MTQDRVGRNYCYEIIDTVPVGEECSQLGHPEFLSLSAIEGEAWKNQIERYIADNKFALLDASGQNELPELEYFLFVEDHDFGKYYAFGIGIKATEDNERYDEYSTFINYLISELPDNWDEEARKELFNQDYFNRLGNE